MSAGTTTEQARDELSWEGWQRSWDRQQEWYMPDREQRFSVMLDMVETLVGPAPRVLDLACGTGSISDRLLRRLPGATSTGVDLDPALLTIARGYFADEPRVDFVSTDLRGPRWTDALPHQQFDAVLTATALHWLTRDELATLYGQVATVLRPGGVLVNVDHMPDPSAPAVADAIRTSDARRRERERISGAVDWEGWWKQAAADARLSDQVARRYEIFGVHGEGDTPPATWHLDQFRAAGFTEATTVWSAFSDVMVLGVR